MSGMSVCLPRRGQRRHPSRGPAQGHPAWRPRASTAAAPTPVYDKLQEWLISKKSLGPQKLEMVEHADPYLGAMPSCIATDDVAAGEVRSWNLFTCPCLVQPRTKTPSISLQSAPRLLLLRRCRTRIQNADPSRTAARALCSAVHMCVIGTPFQAVQLLLQPVLLYNSTLAHQDCHCTRPAEHE